MNANRCPTCTQLLKTATITSEDVARCKVCGQPTSLVGESLGDSGRSWSTEGWASDAILSTPAEALINLGLRRELTQEEQDTAGRFGGESATGLPIPA